MSDSGPFRLGASASKKGFTVAVRSDLYCPPESPSEKSPSRRSMVHREKPGFSPLSPFDTPRQRRQTKSRPTDSHSPTGARGRQAPIEQKPLDGRRKKATPVLARSPHGKAEMW